jgi:uncharacterized protein (TIGR03435 family)
MRLLLPALVVVTLTGHVATQAPAPGPQTRLTFEVASIKRSAPDALGSSVRAQPGGRVVVTNASLFTMIRNAYNTQRFEMVTGVQLPAWVEQERWDVNAKARSEDATLPDLLQMLQNLLVDRFKLDVRRETREMPIYALVAARSDGQLGPQLRRSTLDCEAILAAARAGGPPPTPTSGSVAMRGLPLAEFGRNLSSQAGRVVVDKTGLTGLFDLELKFAPDQGVAAGAQSDYPSLFSAIQEQLGLRLEAQRAPVQVLVVESAERPTTD